jgi:transcriptional regulator with XRE-family HTH domain
MLSRIDSTVKTIWKKMRNKEYRDSFVLAHISNTISAQIYSMRKAHNWTQAELATRCDMKQSRISALEDPDFDNVEVATLQRLASAFDVALSVRFVPFSEIAQRASSLSSPDFIVHDYSNDALEHQGSSSTIALAVMKIFISPTISNNKSIAVPTIGSSNSLPPLSLPQLWQQAAPFNIDIPQISLTSH